MFAIQDGGRHPNILKKQSLSNSCNINSEVINGVEKNSPICSRFHRLHTTYMYDNTITVVSQSRLALLRKSYIYISKKSTKSRTITLANVHSM